MHLSFDGGFTENEDPFAALPNAQAPETIIPSYAIKLLGLTGLKPDGVADFLGQKHKVCRRRAILRVAGTGCKIDMMVAINVDPKSDVFFFLGADVMNLAGETLGYKRKPRLHDFKT